MSFHIVKKGVTVCIIEKYMQGKARREKYVQKINLDSNYELKEFRKMFNSLPDNKRLQFCIDMGALIKKGDKGDKDE